MSLHERSIIIRHRQDIFRLFAPQLSVRLGRETDGEKGCLTCGDFPYEAVELEFEDESKIRFEHAIICEGDECYGIFTEHAGYHLVYKWGIVEAKIVSGGRRKKPRYLKKKEPGQ